MKGIYKCENCETVFQWIAYPITDGQNTYTDYIDGYIQNVSNIDNRDGKDYCTVKCPHCLKTKEIELDGDN